MVGLDVDGQILPGLKPDFLVERNGKEKGINTGSTTGYGCDLDRRVAAVFAATTNELLGRCLLRIATPCKLEEELDVCCC